MSIYIAGINGMLGRSLARLFTKENMEFYGSGSEAVNFLNIEETVLDLKLRKPTVLVIAAAKVGGIGANIRFPVEYLSENLLIQTNLLNAAHQCEIEKVLFIGSSCIYPKTVNQPITEESLLTGPLEESNEPYSIAKIAGLKLVQAYRKQYGYSWVSIMPTNLYGPFDNFDVENSHVLPSLMRKFHEAKKSALKNVNIWGDGTPLREFLHVDDLAVACNVVLNTYNGEIPLNIGTDKEVSILQLSNLMKNVTDYKGGIDFDRTKPNGLPRKLLDSSRMRNLGWEPKIDLENGLQMTYEWFCRELQESGSIKK